VSNTESIRKDLSDHVDLPIIPRYLAFKVSVSMKYKALIKKPLCVFHMRGFDKFSTNFLFKKREKDLSSRRVSNSIFTGPNRFLYYHRLIVGFTYLFAFCQLLSLKKICENNNSYTWL